MTCHDALQLNTVARATFLGIKYVAYSDGAYRHIVRASHYDADIDAIPNLSQMLEGDDEDQGRAYTHWCSIGHRKGIWPDDKRAVRIARKMGLSIIHSATDGTCSTLAVDDHSARHSGS